MDWHVREATVEDVERLALVGAATFLESFAGVIDGGAIVRHCQRQHAVETYRDYFAAGAFAWLAEAAPGAAPVGFALLTRPDLPGIDPDGGDLELKRIYALSRLHGTGAGSALMQAAVERAEREGAPRLLLGVYKGNDRALAFYARKGFTPIGERRFRVGDREYEDLVLARPLGGG